MAKKVRNTVIFGVVAGVTVVAAEKVREVIFKRYLDENLKGPDLEKAISEALKKNAEELDIMMQTFKEEMAKRAEQRAAEDAEALREFQEELKRSEDSLAEAIRNGFTTAK